MVALRAVSRCADISLLAFYGFDMDVFMPRKASAARRDASSKSCPKRSGFLLSLRRRSKMRQTSE